MGAALPVLPPPPPWHPALCASPLEEIRFLLWTALVFLRYLGLGGSVGTPGPPLLGMLIVLRSDWES